MEIKRWSRHGRKPRAPSPQLPPTITQPGSTRGETASCKGRWKGLSCLTRKFHEQFEGGRGAGNSILLPDTDVKDAEWIADLLSHGLLVGSFIPSAPQRELRELTRYRTKLVEERSREINRLQKTLEDTNLKLASVASDLMGRSARDMLAALLAGEVHPSVLAQLARATMRAKRDLLEQALHGLLKPHHRFLLSEQLVDIDAAS